MKMKLFQKYIALQRAIILIKNQLEDFDKELTNEIEKCIIESEEETKEESQDLRDLFYEDSNEKIFFNPLHYLKI